MKTGKVEGVDCFFCLACDYPGCTTTLKLPYHQHVVQEAKELGWFEHFLPGAAGLDANLVLKRE